MPVSPSASDLAAGIESLLKAVTDLSFWDQVNATQNYRFLFLEPGLNEAGKREVVARELHSSYLRIGQIGEPLANTLEQFDNDSSDVLFLVNATSMHGGGADAIWPSWAERKIRLQRLALRLRYADTAAPASRPKRRPANRAKRKPKPSQNDADLNDPVSVPWLRSIVPQATVKGTSVHVMRFLKCRKRKLVKIANKWHCERADALTAFPRQKRQIAEYNRPAD